MALDVGSVVAGTSYRGEFEERLQALLQDCETAGGSVVLFIDEIHVLGEAADSADCQYTGMGML
jgi:ATP-dependent Clp protease ATP-binding subunit ClpA